jgi:sulfotransferase family protein
MAGPRRVDFIIAGAQKSGTSALELYLSEHPEICVPRKQKELHFFDRDRNFLAQPVDYAPYHAFFEPQPWHRVLGEATPDYLYWPSAPERMARYNPALKLIIVLRNPVARAFSHWNMGRHVGRDPLAFWDALQAEPERARTMPAQRAMRFAYVGRGFYALQLKRLWQHFPREQTIVFKTEELLESPATALSRIADFLGIAPFPLVAPRIVHAYQYDTTLSEEARRYLIGIFEPEIRELERLLGWDCSTWLA